MKTTREWRDKIRAMFFDQKDTIALLDDVDRIEKLEHALRKARERIVFMLGGSDEKRREVLALIDDALEGK